MMREGFFSKTLYPMKERNLKAGFSTALKLNAYSVDVAKKKEELLKPLARA